MKEVVEEALKVAGLECLRGRPVPEDGPGDRQLPGQAARVTQLQRGHGAGEKWPRVADTVPGHLRGKMSEAWGDILSYDSGAT